MDSRPAPPVRLESSARFPRWSFASAVAVTLGTIGVFAGSYSSSFRVVQDFEERELAIEQVCGEIKRLDEVLTMSARMCAATGDLSWEQRYQEHVTQLDRAIASAHTLAPGSEESLGSEQTDQANQELVALERSAFDLVRGGDASSAGALLAGERYARFKRIYSYGMERYLRSIHGRVSEVLERERSRAQRVGLLVGVSVPLLLALWVVVGRSILQHVRLRREFEARLQEHALALEQSNREVQAASRAKSDFLARMSHEIRTPMNGVLGVAEVLAETRLDADQARLVGLLRSSGTLLLSIIDDILDLSRIEVGMLRVAAVPSEPRQIAEDVVELLRPQAEGKGIELGFHTDPGLAPWVSIDPLRLRQILMNITGNAIKFTDHGGVELRLGPVSGIGGAGALCFRVRDTGVGIAADKLERIFETFAQADDSISRRFGGSGLGLAISRELARLMGGEIEVRSELGAGTEFSVTLPAPALDPAAAEPPAALPAAAPRWNGRVLVAEDNPVSQIVAQRLLERAGCRVELVSEGAACVRALELARYDLVLMDCNMPGMDGLAAARAIRAAEAAGRRTPIVALTASAFAGDLDACRVAGMDDFLRKPFSAEQLARILARWLGDARAAAPESAAA